MTYRYCVQCGGELNQKDKNLYICSVCGFHFYINPRPTNSVIIENDKGEILLVKRKADPNKGWWDLPGGFVDIGETAEESVAREIQEELGVNLKKIKYLGSYVDRYLYKGDNYHILPMAYSAQIASGKLEASDDVDGYEFFAKDKIPFDRLAFASLVDTIKDYISTH